MAKNIVGEEVNSKEERETAKRAAARAYLNLGDSFGGPNRLITFTEARDIIAKAPQGDDVKARFLEWIQHAEASGRSDAWGHSLRHLGRTWYWEEAGIIWKENQGIRSSSEESQRG